MTTEQQFEQCLGEARRIVASYRAAAPAGCDPVATFGWTAATWAAITAVSAIAGAGVSAYGSYQQGKASDMMAQYNAHQQERNTQMQLMQMQAQSEAQKRAAEAQFALRSQESQARFNNAKTIENQVAGTSAAAREAARRKTEQYQRFVSTQRAAIASSGFVESSGTPLDILADTAGKIQLEREDALYNDELQRRSLFREAELERLGGQLALAGASLDRSSSLASSVLTAASGKAQYNQGMREAEITRLTGANNQYAANWGAVGTVLSGVTSAATALK